MLSGLKKRFRRNASGHRSHFEKEFPLREQALSLKKWIAMFCEGLYVILFSLTDKALRKMDFHLPSFL